MQPLTIIQIDCLPFKIPFLKPFTFAGNTIRERSGFYLTLKTSDGLNAQGEIAPLEGVSQETIRRAKHDLTETRAYLTEFKIPLQKDGLLDLLRHDPHILNTCASVRFAIESAVLMLASQAANKSLAEFLGADLKDVQTAVLLQGTHQEVVADVKQFSLQGFKVFKLKVGDRNIALDVKKIQDIRGFLGQDSYLRLDGNRVWSLKEACIFAELVGRQKIDFIEEPVNDVSQLDSFYQQTRMRVALDETLSVVRSGIRLPGCCSSPLAEHEGVVAYVLKPMILGLVPCLDWIEEARFLKRKAIISAAFESPVGFKVLANLACLSGQIAGLGTERWFKNVKPIVNEQGIIKKELLI
ncbi:MAG: o-succinylbenzoate synthase [Candidatus Omnitrophica bacterium]|nr:o-succinylbenzoate synthase [Candidatus Omnitrophota bacterium]